MVFTCSLVIEIAASSFQRLPRNDVLNIVGAGSPSPKEYSFVGNPMFLFSTPTTRNHKLDPSTPPRVGSPLVATLRMTLFVFFPPDKGEMSNGQRG
jgi:hypothetical protein